MRLVVSCGFAVAVLGRIGSDGGPVLADFVDFAVYLDTGWFTIICPACGAARAIHGRSDRF